MRMMYAAAAALSTVVSAAVFVSPAMADPGSPNDGPGFDRWKHAAAAKRSLAAADTGGWTETVRDGITMLSRRTPVSVTPASGSGTNTRADFDGDGRDDMAAYSNDGVIVNYSSAPYRDHLRTDMPDGGCICFGGSLVSGDFDGDGYDDLAAGDMDEIDTAAGNVHAGAVWIFPGGPDGLRIDAAQHINQTTTGVPGASEAGDWFGGSLAAGDITGDGKADLAVGVPDEALGSAQGAGGVVVLKGSASGIVTTGALWIDQNVSGVPGTAESGDYFGWSLTIGSINKDKYGDLLVGTPLENDKDSGDGSGMITQFWGGASGVSLSSVTSVTGEAVTHAAKIEGTYIWNLGWNMGVTDTNRDGYGEVIVGDWGAEVGWHRTPGAVISLAGRSTGLSATGVKVLSQDSPAVAGATEDEDYFGDSIAVGDMTGDGYGDVLVGVPGEDIGSTVDAGSVVLLRGSSSGLTGTGSQSLDQSSAAVPGAAETNDYFGDAVTLLQLDGTGPLEAVVGTPGEEVTGDVAGFPSGTVTNFPVGSGGLGTGVTTSGKSLVPADEAISRYGLNLVSQQG
jgi:hypothetical protein